MSFTSGRSLRHVTITVAPYHVRNRPRLSLRFFSKAARQNPSLGTRLAYVCVHVCYFSLTKLSLKWTGNCSTLFLSSFSIFLTHVFGNLLMGSPLTSFPGSFEPGNEAGSPIRWFASLCCTCTFRSSRGVGDYQMIKSLGYI